MFWCYMYVCCQKITNGQLVQRQNGWGLFEKLLEKTVKSWEEQNIAPANGNINI